MSITSLLRASLALCLTVLLAPLTHAETSLARVPVYLEYPLLRHLLVRQLFNNPERSREILNDPDGCSSIVLTQPQIGARDDNLEITAKVTANLGVKAFGSCQPLLNWQGGAGFLGAPILEESGKSVRLEPRGSWLIDTEGEEFAGGALGETAMASLNRFLGGFRLDLTPYIASLAAFLPEVLPGRSTEQLDAMVDSLTLSDLQVRPTSLNVAVNARIELPPEPAGEQAPLSAEELQQWEATWKMMDSLLVSTVEKYAAATQLQSLRGALLDILIDSRYRLRDALVEPADRHNDAVRDWFIDSWHNLNPVLREIALDQPGQEELLWFSAVMATDALYAINALGRSVGLEISAEGLRRLARMISAEQAEQLLQFDEEVNPELQRLLREEIEAADPNSEEIEAADPNSWGFRLNFSLFPRAHAAEAWREIIQWVPEKSKLDVYLPKVASLLQRTAAKTLQQQKLQQAHRDLYEKLVLATAWQESCWRQFVVLNKRIEPLISSSGDIGLMQVNERVWRGFYDLQKLRWDINYNSASGAEILLSYMVKYALKNGEQNQPGGVANLARASYSAYNGGPSQVSRYRRSGVAKPHREIDRLFWEKYLQVDAGKALNVGRCLGQDISDRR